METITLQVEKRDTNLSAKELRESNLIPIEYYGKGVENLSMQADYQSFRKIYRKAGANTILTLKLGDKEEFNVLVNDVQLDPVTDLIKHVDLINVRMGEEIHTKIPLEFTGTSLAVKDMGGILMTQLSEIDVKCLPKDLISSIEVSIEPLVDFHSFIRVKDLLIPEGISVSNDPEDIVVTVVAPREEKEEEEVVPEEGEEVEGEEGEEGEEAKEGEEKPKEQGEEKEDKKE